MISRELLPGELEGKGQPNPSQSNPNIEPVEIKSERSYAYDAYGQRKTWLYRGFILNDWGIFFCIRPVEGEFPSGFGDLVPGHPGCHQIIGGETTTCWNVNVYTLASCCAIIDRWWNEHVA